MSRSKIVVWKTKWNQPEIQPQWKLGRWVTKSSNIFGWGRICLLWYKGNCQRFGALKFVLRFFCLDYALSWHFLFVTINNCCVRILWTHFIKLHTTPKRKVVQLKYTKIKQETSDIEIHFFFFFCEILVCLETIYFVNSNSFFCPRTWFVHCSSKPFLQI